MKAIFNDDRLIEFIKKWDVSEWKRVRKLAHSDYFSSMKKRLVFRKKSKYTLDLLIRNHAKLKRKKRFGLKVFLDCCGVDSISKDDWGKFTNEILNICYAHIRIAELDEDIQVFSQLRIQEYFYNQGMWDNADFLQRKKINIQPIRNSMGGFWKRYLAELSLKDIRVKENREDPSVKIERWHLGNNLYYHENKLQILCAEMGMVSYKNLSKKFLEKENHLENIPKEIRGYPQIELYSLAYALRKKDCDEDFHLLRKRLDAELENGNIFSPKYLAPLYIILQGHCISRVRQGRNAKQFRREYIGIAKRMIDNNLHIEQGKLSKTQLRNVVVSYIELKEYKNALKFVEDYQDILINGKNNPIVKYCMAYTRYELEEFNEVFSKLDGIRKKEDLGNYIIIDVKLLFLIACIEINKMKVFRIEMNKLKKILEENKGIIADNYIQSWKKTLYYLQVIYLFRNGKNKNVDGKIKKSLISEKEIRHKKWLVSYVDKYMS